MNIYLDLFVTFFKMGLFTFGGGYAMLPLIQSEVAAHGWLEVEEIVNFVAISESTPGPFAINMATFIGMNQGGVLGAAVATLGVVMPSFIIILLVAHFFEKFKNSHVMKGLMTGLRPAAVGLIGAAVITMAYTVLVGSSFGTIFTVTFEGIDFTNPGFYVSILLFLSMAFLSIKKKVSPIPLIGISAAVGILAGYLFNIPV